MTDEPTQEGPACPGQGSEGTKLVMFHEKPSCRYMIAGWKPQWSDGGEISSGLPRYLIDKMGARKIGEMSDTVSMMCYPFQVPGTHDAFRPAASFAEGLPNTGITRDNNFYDAGGGLAIFLGEEPWFRIDLYTQAFFQAVKELGIQRTAAVEGYNGPAPPDLERSVNCSYSKADMKDELEGLGVRFSSYGSDRRSGPTIAMALITLAHYNYPDVEMFRLGAMAPMYSFLTANKEPVGIARDHRSFYDIMRRLRTTFKLDVDLGELKQRGEAESGRLQAMLERVSSSNANAKQIIEKAREEFNYTPFVEPVELDPGLDKALDDILRNAGNRPGDEE